MAAGDISFDYKNNTDVTIEDKNGNNQRASLVVVANGLPETGKAVDVAIQDQITPPVIANFNQILGFSLTSVATVIGEYTITVDDASSFSSGNYVIMYSPSDLRFYLGHVLSKATNMLTMDNPLDFAFPVGSVIKSTNTNLAVNGGTTPVVFGLRGVSETYPFDVVFDVTRIMFFCETASACSLALFGDLTALTKGLVLRKKNGDYYNIFNVKSNGELAGIMYDFQIIASTNPVFGQDGFIGRLTFAGQDKIGVALRLRSGEDVELLVQDDLSGLTKLEVVAEGHVVSED